MNSSSLSLEVFLCPLLSCYSLHGPTSALISRSCYISEGIQIAYKCDCSRGKAAGLISLFSALLLAEAAGCVLGLQPELQSSKR